MMTDVGTLTPKQRELIEKIKEITEQIGEVPTLKMLDENPDWPGRGRINWHFGSYKELLRLAELPTPSYMHRYTTKQLIEILRNFVLSLGRIPSQFEVKMNPNLPADTTYLNLYSDWESVIAAAGFRMDWCNTKMRTKLLDDMWQKYVELGYRLPGPQDIQNDPSMEKVHTYTQIFEDLHCAWVMSGVWEDFYQRQRQEIAQTILDLYKKLGRVPKLSDEGMPNDKLICKMFGSYAEALETLGLKPNYQYYSREKLVRQLKQKYRELGYSPSAKEVDEDPKIASTQTFRKVFGSYAEALEAAKLPKSVRHRYEKEELIEQLQSIYEELGRVPTAKEVGTKPGVASVNVFERNFGSFKEALVAAEIPTRRAWARYKREELICQLQKKAARLERTPKQKEVNADPEMASAHVFRDEFGSFNAALMAAGLEVSQKREYTDEELLESLEQKYLSMGYLETGKRPTNKEINADRAMASTRAYDVHFGSTNQARKLVEERLLSSSYPL